MMLASNWGEVSMSITRSRDHYCSAEPLFADQAPVLAVVVVRPLVAVACSSKIHTSLARTMVARSR